MATTGDWLSALGFRLTKAIMPATRTILHIDFHIVRWYNGFSQSDNLTGFQRMTKMSNEERSAKEIEIEAAQKKADAENATRQGVGTRVRVGQTRGKNPQVIQWEAFDESKPDTLPKSVQEFVNITKSKEEDLVAYLIGGLNDANYTAASDPLAEYVNFSWPQDAQTQFRLVVRNYSRGANVSLEDAVALIKPGFEKQFAPSAQVPSQPESTTVQ